MTHPTKPKTLAGQSLELRAAWKELWAELLSWWPTMANHLRTQAAAHRAEWHQLEHYD